MPLSRPALVKPMPVGSVPVKLQVWGAVPPVAVKLVAVYAAAKVASESVVGVTVIDGQAMAKVKARSKKHERASVARMVKL